MQILCSVLNCLSHKDISQVNLEFTSLSSTYHIHSYKKYHMDQHPSTLIGNVAMVAIITTSNAV